MKSQKQMETKNKTQSNAICQSDQDRKKIEVIFEIMGSGIPDLFRKADHVKLSRFYPTDSTRKPCTSKINYFHSLVPKITTLQETQNIHFLVSMTCDRPKSRLQTENSVNTHLFKPYYVQEHGQTTCYTPTLEIMRHAMTALFQVHEHHGLPQPLISCHAQEESVHTLLQGWSIRRKVIICRIESLLTYLLIEWLKENNTPHETLKAIILAIERSRLSHKYGSFDACLEDVLKPHGYTKTSFFQHFHITRQISRSIFVQGFNFAYRGVKISAVMLPWGLELAEKLTKALLALNGKIRRVGVVGGVGYVGEQSCQVDDIFVPEAMLVGDEFTHRIERVENGMSSAPEALLFPNHTTVKGCLKSVFPQLGKLSNITALRTVLHRIDALDMEFEAIYRGVREYGAELGAIYYIMDLPKLGIHLGDTYYSRDFLEQLFAKFERGKHHCFERTLAYLATA